MIRAARFLADLLYPRRCKACGEAMEGEGRFFCGSCLEDVTLINGPMCSICGRPFTGGAGADHPCHVCMGSPPKFDAARAVSEYAGVVGEAVRLHKYGRIRALKGYMGGLAADGALRWFPGAGVVVPVPLHKKRLKERGFNQALFLAEAVAGRAGMRLSLDALVRTRYTRPQVDLDHSERKKNVRGAFAVARPSEFSGLRVLLVDDVYTTGATVNECAKVLKSAGAREVLVLTVARAVMDR